VAWHPAYYENWNLTIQHQFPLGINLEAAYAGSHGVHLPINSDNGFNINQLPDQDLSLGNALLNEVPNLSTCRLTAIMASTSINCRTKIFHSATLC